VPKLHKLRRTFLSRRSGFCALSRAFLSESGWPRCERTLQPRTINRANFTHLSALLTNSVEFGKRKWTFLRKSEQFGWILWCTRRRKVKAEECRPWKNSSICALP